MNFEFNGVSKFQETIKAVAFPKTWRGRDVDTIVGHKDIYGAIRELWPVLTTLGSSMRDVSRAG